MKMLPVKMDFINNTMVSTMISEYYSQVSKLLVGNMCVMRLHTGECERFVDVATEPSNGKI